MSTEKSYNPADYGIGYSRTEAFKANEGEVSIPIKPDGEFHFTRKWFRNRNQLTFSTYLRPLFDAARPVRMIQIGVFEGMDLVWQFQNTLLHPDSVALAIDPWEVTTKISEEDMDEVYFRAKKNLHLYRKKLHIVRCHSQATLSSLEGIKIGGSVMQPGLWDLVVIDGDHNAKPVYVDAVESLRQVKTGGYLLFDDVRNRVTKKDHVADGLHMFLKEYHKDVEFVFAHRYCNCYRKVT